MLQYFNTYPRIDTTDKISDKNPIKFEIKSCYF